MYEVRFFGKVFTIRKMEKVFFFVSLLCITHSNIEINFINGKLVCRVAFFSSFITGGYWNYNVPFVTIAFCSGEGGRI